MELGCKCWSSRLALITQGNHKQRGQISNPQDLRNMIPYPFLFLKPYMIYLGSTWNRMCWHFCSRNIAHLSLQSLHAILARLRKFYHGWDVFGVHSIKIKPAKQNPSKRYNLMGPSVHLNQLLQLPLAIFSQRQLRGIPMANLRHTL